MTQLLRPAVLVVDDDEGTRDTLELCLKKDCRVIKVADGETALEVLAREEIRVILLDARAHNV